MWYQKEKCRIVKPGFFQLQCETSNLYYYVDHVIARKQVSDYLCFIVSSVAMTVACCCWEVTCCIRHCRSVCVCVFDFNHTATSRCEENISVNICLFPAVFMPSYVTFHCSDIAQCIYQTLHSSDAVCMCVWLFLLYLLPHNLRLIGPQSPKPCLPPPLLTQLWMINTM